MNKGKYEEATGIVIFEIALLIFMVIFIAEKAS
jgi:hypothetical protein